MSGIENGNRAFRLVHLRACLALLLPALGASLLAAFLGGWAAAAEERSAACAVPLDAVKTAPAEQSVPSIDSSAKAPATPPLIRPNTSQYWIGVVTQSPIPEPLRVHLGLKEDQGIMVVDVAPRSPAAAAPLLRYDLLLKADGKALTKADDLLAALDAGQGRKMDLELMRGGQRTHLEITPAKRPPEARPARTSGLRKRRKDPNGRNSAGSSRKSNASRADPSVSVCPVPAYSCLLASIFPMRRPTTSPLRLPRRENNRPRSS